jgi:hypothetical protein
MVLAGLASRVDALFAVLIGAAALMTLLRLFEFWAARRVARLDASAMARFPSESGTDSAPADSTGSTGTMGT